MYSIINRKMLQRTENKFFPVTDPLLKGAVTAALAALGIFALLFEYPCPFLALTGVPCLGCGTTHAVRELLAGNFSAAFRCHGMFWMFPLIWLYFCADFRLLKNKKCNDGAFAAIVIGYLLDYALRVLF